MTAFNGYPVSIFFAVIMHTLVIVFVLYFEKAETEVLNVVRPPVIKAILVNENPQARNEQVQQQRETQRVENQRAEQRRQEQQRQEQQRQEQQTQDQQRQQAERELQQVQQRQQVERDRQQEEQRQRELTERQNAERAQQQRQQELAAQQQAAQNQARLDAESQERAETEDEMVMAYTAIIHDLVQRQWSRPPSARNGMVVVLRLRLAPTGDIIGTPEIVSSSGDFAFDRAAEAAVLKVNRFAELQGMPPRMFERNFRSLLLTFRPEDLLN